MFSALGGMSTCIEEIVQNSLHGGRPRFTSHLYVYQHTAHVYMGGTG